MGAKHSIGSRKGRTQHPWSRRDRRRDGQRV